MATQNFKRNLLLILYREGEKRDTCSFFPPATEERDISIPGLGQSPGEGTVNPLQYSCLENPMDRGAWQAKVHRVAQMDVTEATYHAHIIYMQTNQSRVHTLNLLL